MAPGIKGSNPFIPIKENSSIGRAAVSKIVDMGSSPFFLEFYLCGETGKRGRLKIYFFTGSSPVIDI